MMNFNLTWKVAALSLATLATISGCSNDDFDNVSSQGQTVITAGFEQPGAKTRTAVNSSNQVVWLSGDAFKLFYTQTGNSVGSSVFTTLDDTKQTSASFTGTALPDGATAMYAVYPSANVNNLNGNTVFMTLPSELTASEASNGPMYAVAGSDYTNLQFKHLCGLLKLTVTNLPTTAKQFVVSATENIAGTATADLSANTPTLTLDALSHVSSSVKVTSINVTANGTQQTFYIPIPAGTYTNLKAKITDESGSAIAKYKEKVWPSVSVARAQMLYATFGFDIEVNAESGNISEQIQAIAPTTAPAEESTTSVLVSGSIDATSTSDHNAKIEVPVVENSNISLTFNDVPTTSAENPLKITEKDVTSGEGTSANESKNVITIAIPAGSVGGQSVPVPSLMVTTPNSTTELAAVNESEGTAFQEVTALTAKNTLVINKNVKVNKLIVKGGNIFIKSGATVGEITKGWTGDEKCIVYVETGANYPNNLSTSDFDVQYVDMTGILKNGGTLTLEKDIELTEPLVVSGSDVTIDLNGYTITATSLTAPEGMTSDDALVIVRRGAKLTINDTKGTGSIDGTGWKNDHCAVKLTDSADQSEANIAKGTATLVVNGGTLKGLQAGISGNGNRHDTSITINGGHILSQEQALSSTDGVGIYHPQDGTLTINGGTIEGYQSGVEIRSGKLEMTGGTLKSWATSYTEAANGSGTTMSGTALAVSQHTTEKAITVNITGGSFEGVYALSEKDLQNPTGTVTLSVTGGTFKGKVASVHGSDGFIKGGNFNDVSAVNYVAEGGNINVTLVADASMETFKLSANKTATIDLNKKTLNLNSKDYDSVIYGTVLFKSGTITVADDAKANHTIYGLEGCNITLDGVTLNGGYYAMLVQGPQAKVEVKNHSIINAKYFTFSTNATGSDDGEPDWGYNATITLTDSKFIAEETGFMNNVPATVTIENCEFKGNHQAALLRGGHYTIKNSTFILNAELPYDNAENKHFKKDEVTMWGQGNQCAFAGITIGNYGGNSYQYETTVEMTGVKVNVVGTYASAFPALHACANSAEGKGVTITYDDTSSFSSSYSPAIEYGTTNIKVNSKDVTEVDGSYVVPTTE